MTNLAASAQHWVRNSMTLKMFFTGFLVLILLIPVALVSGVISERSQTLQSAQLEVGQKWGLAQTVGGPVLTIPYMRGSFRSKAYFLPETLNLQGQADTQIRQRGSFEIPLYTGTLELTGSFARPNFAALGIEPRNVLWREAKLQMGLTDLKGLQESPTVLWNGASLAFQPNPDQSIFSSGLFSPIADAAANRLSTPFKIQLKVNGSRSLQFIPLGRETQVSLTSDWATPGFNGAFLPAERKIDPNGFTASWKVLDLNLSTPLTWKSEDQNQTPLFSLESTDPKYGYASSDAFGLEFVQPVDIYQKSERSVKYAGLFIVLTFLVYFLFEVLLRMRIHPIQYLLVGFALVLFYLLLLSLSEQMPFGPAYLIASAATVSLIGGYTSAFLQKKTLAVLLGLILVGLYAYLYVLLQMEDLSLLSGSLGLFAILATVMVLTRKIDWYQAGAEKDPS